MRWFKHMVDASEDPTIAEIEAEFGLEGYARWWKLLEKVASQMKKPDECSASYPWEKWQTFLKGKRKKLETFLEHLENKQKINLKQNGNVLEITIPNLLKIKDNYTKNLQAADKKVSKQKEEELKEQNSKGAKVAEEEVATTPLTLQDLEEQLTDPLLTIAKCFLTVGYEFTEDNLNKFKTWLDELAKDYPDRDLASNARGWRDYNEVKEISNHKNSFRSWVGQPFATRKQAGGHGPRTLEELDAEEERALARAKLLRLPSPSEIARQKEGAGV